MKHLTSAHDDERIAALICEDGLEAYGFYWLLCEVIAGTMDSSDRCELTYPLPHWSRVLYSHHHRVSKYLGKLEVRGLCEVSRDGSNLTVKIPKLLKYRDEYSRKSGQSKEKVQSDAGPKIERQIEKETEKKQASDDESLRASFELRWKSYPARKVNKEKCWEYFRKSVKGESELEDFDQALRNYLSTLTDTSYAQRTDRFFRDWRKAYLDGFDAPEPKSQVYVPRRSEVDPIESNDPTDEQFQAYLVSIVEAGDRFVASDPDSPEIEGYATPAWMEKFKARVGEDYDRYLRARQRIGAEVGG